jgi:uncharacterized membrane protein YhaH (DUF805 family)
MITMNEALSPVANYKTVLTKKYTDFAGRARRSEYFWFALVHAGIALALFVLAIVLLRVSSSLGQIGFGIYGLYALATLIPGLALAFRRMHDINKSAWWLLINIIPVIGSIIGLIFLFTDSKKGTNDYGVSPKYGA